LTFREKPEILTDTFKEAAMSKKADWYYHRKG